MSRAGRPAFALAALAFASALLGGCATTPRDGPPSSPPPGVDRTPDAEPRLETIRPGGANKPYVALGRSYVPMAGEAPFAERGLASWYGSRFHGRRTASGEPYDMYAMTAAHPTLPIPSYARVTNPANGREVIVRINDRGPFAEGRIVDLSYAAAARLGVLRGVAPVELVRITPDEIRAGRWRRDGETRTATAEAAPRGAVVSSEVVARAAFDPSDVRAIEAAPAVGGFWIQLGAFRDAAGADRWRSRLESDLGAQGPRLASVVEGDWVRVQAGPYADRDEARAALSRVREATGVAGVVVERR